MISPATWHFPQYRFSDGTKWLYNPILKKRFANRPEERVRLQYVEYLLTEIKISKNRIGFEAPIKLPEAENTLRADLVLFDRAMNPFVLIECKSEQIRLNDKVAEQITRYNRKLNATYLMITNGTNEIWYHIDGLASELSKNPFESKVTHSPSTNTDFWEKRRFISSQSNPKTKKLASSILNKSRDNIDKDPVQYLDLPPTLTTVQLNHYYFVYTPKEGCKMAITILDNGIGNTILTGILNRDGINQGIVMINLDHLSLDSTSDITMISSSGSRSELLPAQLTKILLAEKSPSLKKMGEQLLIFFD